jgi:hypothetical protein
MIVNTICDHLAKRVYDGELSNDDLLQIIELCGSLLNLQTISDYAKTNKLSYNGAKRFRTNITLFNTKFIIDND